VDYPSPAAAFDSLDTSPNPILLRAKREELKEARAARAEAELMRVLNQQ